MDVIYPITYIHLYASLTDANANQVKGEFPHLPSLRACLLAHFRHQILFISVLSWRSSFSGFSLVWGAYVCCFPFPVSSFSYGASRSTGTTSLHALPSSCKRDLCVLFSEEALLSSSRRRAMGILLTPTRTTPSLLPATSEEVSIAANVAPERCSCLCSFILYTSKQCIGDAS